MHYPSRVAFFKTQTILSKCPCGAVDCSGLRLFLLRTVLSVWEGILIAFMFLFSFPWTTGRKWLFIFVFYLPFDKTDIWPWFGGEHRGSDMYVEYSKNRALEACDLDLLFSVVLLISVRNPWFCKHESFKWPVLYISGFLHLSVNWPIGTQREGNLHPLSPLLLQPYIYIPHISFLK